MQIYCLNLPSSLLVLVHITFSLSLFLPPSLSQHPSQGFPLSPLNTTKKLKESLSILLNSSTSDVKGGLANKRSQSILALHSCYVVSYITLHYALRNKKGWRTLCSGSVFKAHKNTVSICLIFLDINVLFQVPVFLNKATL